MKLVCAPGSTVLPQSADALRITLYGQPATANHGSAGEAIRYELQKRGLNVAARAWDLLSIALSVTTADVTALRTQSPDGWTREFELDVAVADPTFWNSQAADLSRALAFLTTDRWTLRFHEGGFLPAPFRKMAAPAEDCAMLLSGGLDSLVSAIDLTASGRKPFAISQVVRGDAEKQADFAARIGGGLNHLPLNHNASSPGADEGSQRARSLAFIAYGIAAATALRRYRDGERVTLYVCENGFIAVNPPLTGARLGSLSTRTAHPEYLARLQLILDAAGLRVKIETPYATRTKGEMLRECADQQLLRAEATRSTSCGRFQRFNYRQCGRCVPCQVRRAAFRAWGMQDTTGYVYEQLGRDHPDYAGFDDVRSVAIAIAAVGTDGFDAWLGNALSSPFISARAELRDMVKRGLEELEALHEAFAVK